MHPFLNKLRVLNKLKDLPEKFVFTLKIKNNFLAVLYSVNKLTKSEKHKIYISIFSVNKNCTQQRFLLKLEKIYFYTVGFVHKWESPIQIKGLEHI